MPLYEYRCTNCGNVFEKIQSFSAPEQSECPKCAGRSERMLSAPAIQFKGSGFYLTDYGKASSKSGAKEGGSDAKPASESKGSGENKGTPAAAPASAPASGSGSGGSSGSGGGSGSAPASS